MCPQNIFAGTGTIDIAIQVNEDNPAVGERAAAISGWRQRVSTGANRDIRLGPRGLGSGHLKAAVQIIGCARELAIAGEIAEVRHAEGQNHTDDQERDHQLIEREAVLVSFVHAGNIPASQGRIRSIRPTAFWCRQAVEFGPIRLT